MQAKMQQIVYYTHEICFSHMGQDGEQYYQPKFYISHKPFDLEPMEDIVVVLESCGANWFRTGISHDMMLANGKFEFAKNSPKQLCLLVRNYSDQAHIHVEQGTELVSLLDQSEIIYKIVGIPTEFFRNPRPDANAGWTSNAEDDKTIDEDDDEEEIREMYYVKIFKK